MKDWDSKWIPAVQCPNGLIVGAVENEDGTYTVPGPEHLPKVLIEFKGKKVWMLLHHFPKRYRF